MRKRTSKFQPSIREQEKNMANTDQRVLLVEDDKVDQLAFKRLVKTKNLPYDYTIAGSVAEAKKILEANRFDLIITDYYLGDGDAFALFDTVDRYARYFYYRPRR
jgi:PleD family two-component response regulator